MSRSTTHGTTTTTAGGDDRRRIFWISGNIGAGKSTCLKRLKRRFEADASVSVVEEPVSVWEETGLLAAMYATTSKTRSGQPLAPVDLHLSTFQITALTTRFSSLMQALKDPSVRTLVCERFLIEDKSVFADSLLEEGPSRTAYDLCYRALVSTLPLDIEVHPIFLDVDLSTAVSRIRERDRAAESAVDAEYWTTLDRSYRSLFGRSDAEDGPLSSPFVRTPLVVDARRPADEVYETVVQHLASELGVSRSI